MEQILRRKEMAEIILLPVRHHSPACAWHIVRMIEKLKPDAVLIEGPENAGSLIPAMIHEETKAPFAVYYSYQDQAVLYRTNAQSRLIEERCIFYNIPYRLVGGVNFYQRKEIKDVLAYLKTIANGVDDLSVIRIINVPKRGIGATTIGRVTAFASEHGMSFYDTLKEAKQIPGIGKAAEKISRFIAQMEAFRAMAHSEEYSIKDLIDHILEDTGYEEELQEEGEIEVQTRLENIEELINKAAAYEEDSEHPTLDGFLEQVALVADIDNVDDSEERVTLMTLHSAKGLEFPKVYLVGMEDGLFPGMMSIMSGDKTEMEEERRLCYVGITRAKKELVLTAASQGRAAGGPAGHRQDPAGQGRGRRGGGSLPLHLRLRLCGALRGRGRLPRPQKAEVLLLQQCHRQTFSIQHHHARRKRD